MGPAVESSDQRWPDVRRTLDRQPWDAIESLTGSMDLAATLPSLRRFIELLVQWNRSVSNLISQNDESRVVAAHLAPSIEPIAWMKSHDLNAWLDFGSGGGFPAIPLAICGLGRSWDLVESRRTKTLFLRRAVEQLQLAGTSVTLGRLEDLVVEVVRSATGGDTGAEIASRDLTPSTASTARRLRVPFDGFTSRATLALGPTLRLARPIVRAGGAAFLWKGSHLDQEIAEAGDAMLGWQVSERRALLNGQTTVIKFLRTGE